MNLVLIETSGNQQYIFSTNKLRENVGASELTYRVGTQWTLEAIKELGGDDLWDEDGATLRKNLLRQQPIQPNGGKAVEVIVATSGKALLLVQDKDIGKRIIRLVTAKALEYAPGIDVCGVVSNDFNWDKCPLGEVNRSVHEIFQDVRASRPGPSLRFLRLPVVDECATSGLPAREWHIPHKNDQAEPAARSAATLAKWDFRNPYKQRMNRLLEGYGINCRFAENLDTIATQLEEQTDWLAVVHADGNGLGEIFLDFGKHAQCRAPDERGLFGNANRTYANKLRRFSLALDYSTERAFMKVLEQWVERHDWLAKDKKGRIRLPLLPIVLGGDDITIVCEGRAALPFTHEFLRAFEEETSFPIKLLANDEQEDRQLVRSIAETALGAPRLSSCAGVAIVKSHYPFSAAYEIAENLIHSAKQVKNVVQLPPTEANSRAKSLPCSALDFHIHYDTSGSDLDRIRERLTLSEPARDDATGEVRVRLYGRPYVTSDIDSISLAGAAGVEWARQHHWSQLRDRVEALVAEEDGRRKLPSSQMHDLRAGLFLGRAAANARYKLIRHRHENDYARIAVFDGDSPQDLFELERDQTAGAGNPVYFTKLLDAMDAATLHESKLAEGRGGKAVSGGQS